MIQYIIRRLLVIPLIMFLVSAIIFLLILQVPPEERVLAYLPSIHRLTEEQYEQLVQRTIERYGLDKPPVVQYTLWVSNLVRGDWGYSPSCGSLSWKV